MTRPAETNPGSPEAVEQGCICPILDNALGAGWARLPPDGPKFWINGDCPLHGAARPRDVAPTEQSDG